MYRRNIKFSSLYLEDFYLTNIIPTLLALVAVPSSWKRSFVTLYAFLVSVHMFHNAMSCLSSHTKGLMYIVTLNDICHLSGHSEILRKSRRRPSVSCSETMEFPLFVSSTTFTMRILLRTASNINNITRNNSSPVSR